MDLKESGEMYLETILLLMREKGNVRSIDVANELGYSKPSISRAISVLKKNGFIELDDSLFIRFTEKGKARAESVYERHNVITAFLKATLDVDDETAADDACRIEHIISEKTLLAMEKMLDKK